MSGSASITKGQALALQPKVSAQVWPALKDQMSKEQAQGYIEQPEKILRAVRMGFLKMGKMSSLRLVNVIQAEGAERFDPNQKFRQHETVDDVNIRWIDSLFREHLLDEIEEDVPPAKLAVHDLREDLSDDTILSALTGRAISAGDELQAADYPVSCKRAHVWTLLKAQADRGSDGPLLVNGRPNIFYISDVDGVLRVVSATMHVPDAHWSFGVKSAADRLILRDPGCRVFSRIP